MEQQLATWWSITSAYVNAPTTLLDTPFQPMALLPTFGLICLLVGVALALKWRQRKALWLLAPGLIAAMTPITMLVGFDILGWVGLGFIVIISIIGLLLWVGIIANDVQKRSSIWLLGLFEVSYLLYVGGVAIAMIWGT